MKTYYQGFEKHIESLPTVNKIFPDIFIPGISDQSIESQKAEFLNAIRQDESQECFKNLIGN